MVAETSVIRQTQHKQVLSLVVAVLTYRRPETLAAHLPAVCGHVLDLVANGGGSHGGRLSAQVLVVDNDPAGSGEEAVEATGLAVRYVVESRPGIAAARNRALREAQGSDLLVFIDDDEEPLPGWLDSLVTVWRRTGAAGVIGRVVPDYQVPPEPWIEAGEFFVRRTMPTGTDRPAGAAGNLLLDLHQLARTGILFEEPFGMTGGEDTLMTRRMTARGLRLVWCNESVAKDLIPVERLTKRWVLRRAWSHGNSHALIDIHLASSSLHRALLRAGYVAGGSARILVGGAQLTHGFVAGSLRDRARGARMIWRGSGVLAGAFGFAFEEYARSDAGATAKRSYSLMEELPSLVRWDL